MGFTSHTKFSVTACQEALPSSTFFEDVSRRAIFGNWHNLRPPNKCIYISAKLDTVRKQNLYTVMLLS